MEHQLFHHAKEWVLEAGSIIRESLKQEIEVEFKTSPADLVTIMDRKIETYFIEQINHHFPTHFILGEEGMSENGPSNPLDGTVWIIDPIDGTTNFVHQKRNFSISVGIYQNGEAQLGFIYDPVEGELFYAEKGKGAYLNGIKLPVLKDTTLEHSILSFNHLWLTPNEKCDYKKLQVLVEKARGTRCIGSASLEMAYVACGRLDAYLDFRLSPWDIAAGLLILDEVNIKTLTIEGKQIDVFHPSTTVFSRTKLSNEIINLLL